MKQLIQTILSIPLNKFRTYLLIKNGMKPNDLIYSLLYFKAINEGFAVAEVLQFNDPLFSALKQFNDDLTKRWEEGLPARKEAKEEQAPPGITEEDRLDLLIKLFQEYDREYSPDLKSLKQKIEALIDLYQYAGAGYIAFTLTSLFSTVAFVYNQKKTSYYSFFSARKSTVVPTFENEKILDIYASLSAPAEAKLINLLKKIAVECGDLKNKIDTYIEEYVFSIIVAVHENGAAMDDFFLTHPDLCQAIDVSEKLTVLQACLYDKGKNAADRLALFCHVFTEENKKIHALGNGCVDELIFRFKQSILLSLSSNSMAKNALFRLKASPDASSHSNLTLETPAAKI